MAKRVRFIPGSGGVGGWAGGWRGLVVLVLVCAAVYLPGLTTIEAVDRDESRFAQASRQMFESAVLPEAEKDGRHAGGWVVPMVGTEARLNKPPLVYYLQVASAWAWTGGRPNEDAVWMYRVPSALAAVVSVLLTWRMGVWWLGGKGGLFAAAMLAVSPMVVWEAHQARADIAMVAWTTGAQWCLWRLWAGGGGVRWAVLMWVAVAGGVMTKGPVTPMVVGLTVAALCWWGRADGERVRGFWGRLRVGVGVVVVGAAVVPWVWMVAERQGGVGVYARGVWEEFFVRGAAGSKEGHFWPPGFHTVLAVVLLWPGSLTTAAGVAWAWGRGMERRAVGAGWWARVKGVVLARMVKGERVEGDGRGGVRGGEGGVFLLAWVVPAWVVFELSMAKLPHYTLPMYPALALLGARVVMRRAQGGVRARWGEWVPWAVVSVGVGVAMVVGARAGGWRVEEWRWGVVAGLVVAGAGVVLGGRAQRGAWGGFGAAGVGMGMVATMGVCGLVLPRQNELSAEVARQVRVVSWEGARPVGLVTYRPNSLVFELRGKVERVRAGEAEVWLKGRPRGVLVYLDGEERWDWGKGTGKVERQVAGWGVLAGVAWGRNVGEGLVGREERRVVLIEGRR